MASVQGASPLQMRVSADKLLCSICLEVFRQPATIPCGHSFCLECIEELWERQAGSGAYSCPQCRQAFNPRPALRPNPVLCGIALDLLAEPQPEAVEEVSPGLTPCDVCTAARQPAARSCLLCLASYCKWHLRPAPPQPRLPRPPAGAARSRRWPPQMRAAPQAPRALLSHRQGLHLRPMSGRRAPHPPSGVAGRGGRESEERTEEG